MYGTRSLVISVISSLPPRFSLFSANTALKLVGPKKPLAGLPCEFLSNSAAVLGLEGALEYREAGTAVTLLDGDTTVLEPVVGVSGKVMGMLEMGSDCLLLTALMDSGLLELASFVRVIGALMYTHFSDNLRRLHRVQTGRL